MRTDDRRTVDGMDPIKRRKLLQTGLAGVGVLGAVGVSFGLAGATHGSSDAGGGAQRAGSHPTHVSDRDGDSDSSSRTGASQSEPSVSPPQPSPPQATTSGS